MPNYSYTASSAFTPFTFEQLAAPAIMYDTAYKEVETGLNELANQAAVLDYIAKTNPEARSSQMYNQYMNTLNQAAEDLSKNGLSKGSRSTLMGLRKAYAQNIIPIQQAYGRRGQLVDAVLEQKAKDNSLIFDRDPSTYTLDELMDNPTLTPKSYSGNMIREQVGMDARNLIRGLRSYGAGQPLDSFTNTFITNHGFSQEQIYNALYNPNSSDAALVLNAILNDVIGGSGIDKWGNEEALREAVHYGRRGFWDALGEENVQLHNIPTAGRSSGSGTTAVTRNTIGYTTVGSPGELPEYLEWMKGLRATENGGYSTEELDRLTSEQARFMGQVNANPEWKAIYDEAIRYEEELAKIELSEEEKQRARKKAEELYLQYAKAGSGLTTSVDSIAEDQELYMKQQKLAQKGIKNKLPWIWNNQLGESDPRFGPLISAIRNEEKRKKIIRRNQDIIDKHRYLGGSDYEILQKFNDIEQMQSHAESRIYGNLINDTQNKKIKEALKNDIQRLTDDELKGDETTSTPGFYNVETGDKLSPRHHRKLKEDATWETIGVGGLISPIDKLMNGLVITYDGERYVMRGGTAFQGLNDDLSALAHNVDFTSDIASKRFNKALTNDVASAIRMGRLDPATYSTHKEILEHAKEVPNIPKHYKIASYYQDTENGRDLINVLIDTRTNSILDVQSMNNFLATKGEGYYTAANNMIVNYLAAFQEAVK